MQEHSSLDAFVDKVKPTSLYACTTRAQRFYSNVAYQPGDALLFGPETRGLPQSFLDQLPREQWLRIPMLPDSRSLNLSNAASLILYEAWRQQGFDGAI